MTRTSISSRLGLRDTRALVGAAALLACLLGLLGAFQRPLYDVSEPTPVLKTTSQQQPRPLGGRKTATTTPAPTFFNPDETMVPAVSVDPAQQPAGTLPSDTGDGEGAGTSVWERVRTWTGVAPGATVGPADVPVRDGGVPRRMFTIWNERKLGFRALLLHRRWLGAERGLEHVIVTQAECSELASLRPGFRAVFDALPMVVMRADVCRVLVLYLFGGYWRDLDVDFRRPLGEWVNASLGLTVGYEDEEHVCTWFFAARPGDVCLGHVLQHMENVVRNASVIDLRKNSESVIDMTGPGAMTDGLQGCPYGVKFDFNAMRRELVHHEYAGEQWKKMDDYKSWLKDRDARSKDKASKEFSSVRHALSRQEEFLVPERDDMPPVAIQEVKVPRVMDGLQQLLHGPLDAFDGSIDTFYDSGSPVNSRVATKEWFSIELVVPLTIGTAFGPEDAGPDHLAGLRIVNRHFEPGINLLGGLPVELDLYDNAGVKFWTARKAARHASFFQFYFAGFARKVKKIVIRRESGASGQQLTFGEIQLCSDPQCTLARKVEVVSPTRETPKETPVELVLRQLTTLSRRCPKGRALSPAFGFTVCGAHARATPPSKECTAVLLVMNGHLDMGLARSFASLNCTTRPIGRGPIKVVMTPDRASSGDDGGNPESLPAEGRARFALNQIVDESFCNGECFTMERLLRAMPDLAARRPGEATSPSLVTEYVHVSMPEDAPLLPVSHTPLGLALALRPPTMFVELPLSSKILGSAEFKDTVRVMTRSYDVVAFHTDSAAAGAGANSKLPAVLQLSLVLKPTD